MTPQLKDLITAAFIILCFGAFFSGVWMLFQL